MTSAKNPPGGRPARRILIVGMPGGTNVGSSFHRAALHAGLQAQLLDSNRAYGSHPLVRRLAWHLFNKRPAHLGAFGREILAACTTFQPDLLLTTGVAPVSAQVLRAIGEAGIQRINFLTDDPWNPAHRTAWFMEALRHYDAIYSPRRAMIHDLSAAGCAAVRYLPFGYDPDIFSPVPAGELGPGAAMADVVFAGGADDDRVPFISELVRRGFDVALYGAYWQRHAGLRELSRGIAPSNEMRVVLASAKVGLCLVRKANRDGSCMRTFELPAVGTCMLVEDTEEHRAIFGAEGTAVLYFDSMEDMVQKCGQLCSDEPLRLRLAQSAHRLITQGGNTYGHRLASILAGRGWDDEHA